MHAKGWGAHGTFTVTNDIAQFSKAAIFSAVGKKTEMLARFSTVAGEMGAADHERDVRGFALKFYTEEGNWDLVGNNTPVFFVRDPFKFPDFIRTRSGTPKTNLRSPTAMWDFWSLCRVACIGNNFDVRSRPPVAPSSCTASARTPMRFLTPRMSAIGSNPDSTPSRASTPHQREGARS